MRLRLVTSSDKIINSVQARAHTIPTDKPEADGTFAWHATTLVVVEITGAGRMGLGYTYADACIATLIISSLAKAIDPPACRLRGAAHAPTGMVP